jgi:hypothetical protein
MGIDLSKCIGCQYCLWACQATNNVADDDMRWNVGFPERMENGADFFMTRPWAHAVGHMLHRLTPVMAAVGLGLSLLHQSSLGATYGVLSGREIWFKPSMPVLFILSAIAGGVSLTLLVTLLVSKLSGREVIDKYLRRDIARLAAFALLAYLYLKLWDLGGDFLLQPRPWHGRCPAALASDDALHAVVLAGGGVSGDYHPGDHFAEPAAAAADGVAGPDVRVEVPAVVPQNGRIPRLIHSFVHPS